MAIRIIKKGPTAFPPAPVVDAPRAAPAPPTSAPVPLPGGLRIPIKRTVSLPETAKAAPLISKEYPTETDAERLERWKNFPKSDEKLKQCPHCEQWYIRPCDAAKAKVCANGIHFRSKAA